MKNRKILGIAALIAAIGFLAACGDILSPTDGDNDDKKPVTVTPAPGPNSGGGDKPSGNGEGEKEKEGEGKTVDYTAASVADLEEWLAAQPVNTADTPYVIALNISDFGGSYEDSGSVATVLSDNSTKYVSLDLSGSTFTKIRNGAFGYCTNLTNVTIPNNVTSIGTYAFYGCTSLTSVTIPNNVTSIGSTAFGYCTSLDAINVDTANTAYSSDDGVLYNKAKTTLVGYPAGKTTISFTIPDSVTSIGEDAFSGCISLASITIPNSVTSIGRSAFSDCSSLTSITIPNSVTSIRSWAFGNCGSLTSITIPNSVTSIEWNAFWNCSSLTSITIPNSVTSIQDRAFGGCTSLTSVTFQSTITSDNFGNSAFGSYEGGYIGDLRDKYLDLAGGSGTYTRASDGDTWTKS